MTDNGFLSGGIIIAAVGVVLLRFSWSRPRRSIPINLAGWLALLAGVAAGSVAAGAWGAAVVSLMPMALACTLLAASAFASRPNKRSAGDRSNRRSITKSPLRLGSRLLTFVLVVVAALIVALGLGLATSQSILLAGGGKSNAYAGALFMMPIAWAVLAYAIVLNERRTQFKILAAASLPVLPCLAQGLMS